jgi:hypothetical protein
MQIKKVKQQQKQVWGTFFDITIANSETSQGASFLRWISIQEDLPD